MPARILRPWALLLLLAVVGGLLAATLAVSAAQGDPLPDDPGLLMPCEAQERSPLLYASDPEGFAGGAFADPRRTVGVAADPSGIFALYTAPAGSRPTADSRSLLRPCYPELGRANLVTVDVRDVRGPGPVHADATTLRGETRRDEGGALVTTYAFGDGVELRQALKPEGDRLEVSYTLTNRSEVGRTATVRALVASPNGDPARGDRLAHEPAFRVPGYEPSPTTAAPTVPGGVREEHTLTARRVAPFFARGDGAASGLYLRPTAGRWSPGTAGPAPSLLTFAGWGELAGGPFRYVARLGRELPSARDAAAGVYWEDLELRPGASETVSYSYGLPPGRTGPK